MFGLTEPQIAAFGMTVGVGALILYMLFIVANLAKESQAGRTGTIVLFFVLSFGMVGYLAKTVLEWWMGR